MTTLYAIGGLVLVAGLALWLGMRTARREGVATEQAKEAANVVKAAERVADATAGAPRTADELVDRVSGGRPL